MPIKICKKFLFSSYELISNDLSQWKLIVKGRTLLSKYKSKDILHKIITVLFLCSESEEEIFSPLSDPLSGAALNRAKYSMSRKNIDNVEWE